MRKAFSLEKAQFSDSSEDDVHFPSPQLLELYNKQYSFLIQETNQFFRYCKEAIHKYISLNQFGAGFNIPFLYTNILSIEQQTLGLNDSHKQLLEEKNQQKKRYEGSFNTILKRMGKIIQDLLDFEVNFKRDYLEQNIKKTQKNKNKSAKIKSIAFQESLGLSPVNSAHQDSKYEQQTFSNQENQIRSILQQKMCLQLAEVPKVCSKAQNPITNINKLIEKVDTLRKNMKECKSREQKMLQIFNRRKFVEYQAEQVVEQGSNRSVQVYYQKITESSFFQKIKQKHQQEVYRN